MKINFVKFIQFFTICCISLSAGIKYDSVIGIALFVALTTLVEIKDAVEKVADK